VAGVKSYGKSQQHANQRSRAVSWENGGGSLFTGKANHRSRAEWVRAGNLLGRMGESFGAIMGNPLNLR
jgi:hypothetical protein